MRVHDEDDDESVEVNLAPLIDCIFLLLVFFLLTSTIQRTEDESKKLQALALDLPQAGAAAEPAAQPPPLVISIDDSGRVYVNERRVGVEALHQAVREAAQRRAPVRVEGDRRAQFDQIARVIDLCSFEGLQELSIRTRDK